MEDHLCKHSDTHWKIWLHTTHAFNYSHILPLSLYFLLFLYQPPSLSLSSTHTHKRYAHICFFLKTLISFPEEGHTLCTTRNTHMHTHSCTDTLPSDSLHSCPIHLILTNKCLFPYQRIRCASVNQGMLLQRKIRLLQIQQLEGSKVSGSICRGQTTEIKSAATN